MLGFLLSVGFWETVLQEAIAGLVIEGGNILSKVSGGPDISSKVRRGGSLMDEDSMESEMDEYMDIGVDDISAEDLLEAFIRSDITMEDIKNYI